MSKFLPFNEALIVAQSLRLASRTEWHVWCRKGMRPPNVPSTPRHVYKHDGGQGWGHWLGTVLRVLPGLPRMRTSGADPAPLCWIPAAAPSSRWGTRPR